MARYDPGKDDSRGELPAEMIAETLIGISSIGAGAFAFARRQRQRLYARLNGRLQRILHTCAPDLADAVERALPGFEDRLAVLPGFLPDALFRSLKDEAERLVAPERSFVPIHKKGGTVAYETLIEAAPQIVSLYHAPALMAFVSRLTGCTLVPTPICDQSSLSVLVYERPGDHIGWHFDHNFYRGRHFTLLLALDNRGTAAGGLSHATLKARTGGRELSVSSAPNTMIVFEGAAVRHKVTPILDGERRLMLSMTYCTDPGAALWQGASRRIKDIAFFGPRALWT